MIYIDSADLENPYSSMPIVKRFPNGEKKYMIPEIPAEGILDITMIYEDDSEFFDLLCIVDSILRNNPNTEFVLNLPYVPYSRMDRIESKTDSLSLKSFASFVNNLIKPKRIKCLDAHSDVTLAVFDAPVINHVPQIDMVKKNFSHTDTLLVFPDATAVKRYKKLFSEYQSVSINKEHDFQTGKIISSTLVKSGNISDEFLWNIKNVVIVDDICSKGGTFLLASKLIKENIGHEDYVINLVVAHCEASIFEGELFKENSPFNGKVYCTNSMPAMVEHLNMLKDLIHPPANRFVITNY
jgi:ribose-phosphate diphosphokinase|nr:MAG TPA: Baseplate wedge protein [Caudoviricetes sp.]